MRISALSALTLDHAKILAAMDAFAAASDVLWINHKLIQMIGYFNPNDLSVINYRTNTVW